MKKYLVQLTEEEHQRPQFLLSKGRAAAYKQTHARILLLSNEGRGGEALLHLDSESFVDALEKIARGEQDMLPPFSSMEEQLQRELAHLEDTHSRFRAVVSGLTPEQLSQITTRPNPSNSFPGLTLLELVERVSGHEATHSRQIGLTRKYVEAFRSREHAVSIITLGDGSPYRLPEDVGGLSIRPATSPASRMHWPRSGEWLGAWN